METPWVTCICPTRNRKDFLIQSIECFLLQTYPNKQLLIMDDGYDPLRLGELPPRLWSESILYNRRATPAISLGAKRNALCEMARSEFIAHWDDDDWYHPLRLQEQVASLKGAPGWGSINRRETYVTGYNEVPFYDVRSGAVNVYKGRPSYAIGSSLLYYRCWWEYHRFIEKGKNANNGEDTAFVWSAAGAILTHSGVDRMVARVHPGSTTFGLQNFAAVEWTPRDASTLPREFRELVAA